MSGARAAPGRRLRAAGSEPVRALLLDIEGTTTPLDFVHDVLFPFARARVRAYLAAHAADPPVVADLTGLAAEHAADVRKGLAPPPWSEASEADRLESAVAYLHWLMDRDRKSAPLKSLQGRVWEKGYHSHALVAPVFADVPPALERWRRQGKQVAIFSSGSVLAQRLLFAHSSAGDLTPLLAGYYDTSTGPKQEAASYRRIADALGCAPAEVQFVSDAEAELDASRSAGMRTSLCLRGQEPASGRHPILSGFDTLFP